MMIKFLILEYKNTFESQSIFPRLKKFAANAIKFKSFTSIWVHLMWNKQHVKRLFYFYNFNIR